MVSCYDGKYFGGFMKGVVLAGGTGSRLFPLTKITNKHLLPIYDKPMIYYPIQTLVDAGIDDIMIVTGGRSSGDFLRLLANGKAAQFTVKDGLLSNSIHHIAEDASGNLGLRSTISGISEVATQPQAPRHIAKQSTRRGGIHRCGLARWDGAVAGESAWSKLRNSK